MSRFEAKAIVENNGGKVLGLYLKNLTFWLWSQNLKKKNRSSEKINIKIILEKDWNNI